MDETRILRCDRMALCPLPLRRFWEYSCSHPRGAEVEEIVNVVAIAVVDARETDLTTAMPEITKSVAQAD